MESLECGIISVRLWLCLSGTPMNHALRKAFLSDGIKPEPERLLDFDIETLTCVMTVFAYTSVFEMSELI
jgi:hypothetical protein